MQWSSLIVLAALAGAAQGQESVDGAWRAWLDSPGGDLAFGLELHGAAGERHATIVNGPERIEADSSLRDGELTIDFPHYDSRIVAHLIADGARLDGTWRKRRSADAWVEMKFHAARGPAPVSIPSGLPPDTSPAELARMRAMNTHAVARRYSVRFSSSDEPAVAILNDGPEGLCGTFLTTTGDYRYLAGDTSGILDQEFALSCFDGAHAFLFKARVLVSEEAPDPILGLEGDFWSGDRWHETWTATPDPTAALPDGFTLTHATRAVTLDDLVFPDLDGTPRRLSDPQFAGKARLIEIFGSWCPNCADEADELVRLQKEYGVRGLTIIGLAFEVTGDFARDAEQVRRYAARHGVTWPLLVAGLADKDKATASLGLLDKVRAFPTTIFLDEQGKVRAVYTGFSGPATGAAYAEQHAEFVRVIEGLLGP